MNHDVHAHHRARGFTLLELLVGLVFLGLLVGYVAPGVFGRVGMSEAKMATAQTRALEDSLNLYGVDIGPYPANALRLVPINSQLTRARWLGSYL